MTAAIVSLLATVAGLVAWFVKRRAVTADSPKEQLNRKRDENDQAIARGDVNELLERRLRNTSPRDPGGSGSDAPGAR